MGATVAVMFKPAPKGDTYQTQEPAALVEGQNSPKAFMGLPAYPTVDQYVERIHGLGRDMPQAEQSAFITWIRGPKPRSLFAPSWHWAANEVMGILCNQVDPSSNLVPSLMAICRERQGDPVLRDYAIQHLASCFETGVPAVSAAEGPVIRKQIVETLLDAANEKKEALSGTALQGLHRIVPDGESGDRPLAGSVKFAFCSLEQLRTIAFVLATAPDANHLARITALQICAQRRVYKILPEARMLAEDRTLPTSLRLSAIGAIGQLGAEEDKLVLLRVKAELAPRLSKALQKATQRISQRAATAANGPTK